MSQKACPAIVRLLLLRIAMPACGTSSKVRAGARARTSREWREGFVMEGGWIARRALVAGASRQVGGSRASTLATGGGETGRRRRVERAAPPEERATVGAHAHLA